jgi:glycine dehydrogenase subunit 1
MTGPRSAAEINARLANLKILGGLPLERFYPELGASLLLCCTEMSRRADMDAVAEAFGA